MADECFDFAFVARAWTWSHRIGEQVVGSSTRSFPTLNDCIADARKAGFHADADTCRKPSASAMPSGDAGAYSER